MDGTSYASCFLLILRLNVGDNIKKEAGQGRSQPADVLELYFFNADDVVLTDNDLSSLPDCPVEVDF